MKRERVEAIADHYNRRPKGDLKKRKESQIIKLRSFNNWIKSVLINEYTNNNNNDSDNSNTNIRDIYTVLDLACGKGGDLTKWKHVSHVRKLIGVDIAKESITEAIDRCHKINPPFEVSFHAFDAFHDSWDNFMNNMAFNVVSCQFALHYAFDSSKAARHTLKEIGSRMRKGGYFFGTIPNASKIKSMALKYKTDKVDHDSKGNHNPISFGNLLYDCTIDNHNEFLDNKEDPFGKSYIFSLRDSIDSCPEYLVEFPILEALAEENNLELELKLPFREFYESFKMKYKKLLMQFDIITTESESMELKLTNEELEIAGRKIFK